MSSESDSDYIVHSDIDEEKSKSDGDDIGDDDIDAQQIRHSRSLSRKSDSDDIGDDDIGEKQTCLQRFMFFSCGF